MFNFDGIGNFTALYDYSKGTDRLIYFEDYADLHRKFRELLSSLTSHSDFQDVTFIYRPFIGADERIAIRVLVELDSDFEKVARYVKDRREVPHVAYFVNLLFSIVDFEIDDYLESLRPDFTSGRIQALAS